MKKVTRVLVFVCCCCLVSPLGFAGSSVLIGTGGVTGVYYPVGKAICQMVNLRSAKYGLRYESKKSHGTLSNIKAVMNGNIELGFAQSDCQYEAYNGLGSWRSAGPQKNLRSVFSIYPEVITLVASQKSNITSLDDLRGKRVNIGHRGSGQHKNAMELLEAANIHSDAIQVKQSKAAKILKLLQGDKVDAFFYTAGHPNRLIKEISKNISISIIPVTGPGIDALISKYPYYTKARIPRTLYPDASNRADIESVGVKAILITSRKVNNHVIYSIVKEVFENLNELKTRHPALARLTKEKMLKGFSAPIHEGALMYYREAGLIR